MKSLDILGLHSLTTIIVLVFFSSCSFLPSASAQTRVIGPDTVYDVRGRAVTAGNLYYVVAASWRPRGGALTVVNTGNIGCGRYTVVQDRSTVGIGIPCRFSSVDPGDQNVRLGTFPYNIIFDNKNEACRNVSGWQVSEADKPTGQRVVRAAAEEGKPGCGTYRNWFRIERGVLDGNAYRIVSAPSSVCDLPVQDCDLGIYPVRNQFVLACTNALGSDFMFWPVTETE